MRSMKFILFLLGMAQIILAAGFFTGQPWAISLWPLAETKFSYAFLAAILAGGAAPLLWIAISDELGGLAGYALGFGILYAGMAASFAGFYFEGAQPSFSWFAAAMGVLAALCVFAFFGTQGYARLGPPTPVLLRLAFALEALVLLGAGILLIMQFPNILPWQLSPRASILYGCIFTGLAFYNLYAVLNASWISAFGPLLGFLVTDVLLLVSWFTRAGELPSEPLLGQITAAAIILLSTALGLYYLFLNPSTRLILRAQQHPR
jgi:hypothetical protein